MFGIIKKAFAFSIRAEFFDAVGVGYLFLFNKGGITLPNLARNHLELRHWVGVIEKTTISIRAHCASAK
jgi:hypothetical protein